jgi:hypothetical protein
VLAATERGITVRRRRGPWNSSPTSIPDTGLSGETLVTDERNWYQHGDGVRTS